MRCSSEYKAAKSASRADRSPPSAEATSEEREGSTIRADGKGTIRAREYHGAGRAGRLAARPRDEVGQQPIGAGDARGKLAEQTEPHVGPGPLSDPGLDERALLLTGVLGERVGHGQDVGVAG